MTDGITYAGTPVLLDLDSQLSTYLEARWPDSAWPHSHNRLSTRITTNPLLRKNRAGLFVSPYPDCPSPRINELIVPTGASRYAKALVVMDRESVESIAETLWGSPINLTSGLPSSWGPSQNAADLVFRYNQKSFTWKMHSLAPVLLDATGQRDLWLLPLVDERYFWNRSSDNIEIPDPAGWQESLTAIAQIIDTTCDVGGGVNASYGEPDKEFLVEAQSNCGAMLDTIAMSIGRRFVYESGVSNQLNNATADNAQLSANLSLPDIRLGGRVPATVLPKFLSVITRKSFDYWGGADETIATEAVIEESSEVLYRRPIYAAWWFDHFTDEYSGLSAPGDGAEDSVRYLADQIAADQLAWGGKQYSASFAGIAEWTMTGHDDYLAINCEEVRGQMSLTTRVVSLPPDFAPRVCIAQRLDRYIHPHDVARFRVAGDISGPRVFGLIIKAKGPYDGFVVPIPIVIDSGVANVGSIVTCAYEHDIGWVEIAANSISGSRVKFRATQDIANRTVTAVALSKGTPRLGSSFEVFDPNNLWGAITMGCVGFASYNTNLNQYEIETCSLPASEIVVEIEDPLLGREYSEGELPTGTVVDSFFLRSTYPNVMKPPECETTCEYTWNQSTNSYQLTSPCGDGCNCQPPLSEPPQDILEGEIIKFITYCEKDGTDNSINIPFHNPLRLDAICNSKVTLQRVSNASWGEPGEDAPNEFGSATEYRWEAIRVEKKHARQITFTFSDGGEVQVESSCDGFDPSVCGDVEVDYPHGIPCDGDLVTAFFCPSTGRYKANITNSAMLGEPDIVDLPVSAEADPCGINIKSLPFKMFTQTCNAVNAEPDDNVIPLGTTIAVLTGIGAGSCGEVAYTFQNLRAFVCDNQGEPTVTQFDDFTLNLGDTKFVYGASFDGCTLRLLSKTIIDACVPYIPGVSGVLPTIISAPIGMVSVNVTRKLTQESTRLVDDQIQILVCGWENIADNYIPLTECPTPGPCDEPATFAWDAELEEWYQVTPCGEGCATAVLTDTSPPFSPDEIRTVPCEPA